MKNHLQNAGFENVQMASVNDPSKPAKQRTPGKGMDSNGDTIPPGAKYDSRGDRITPGSKYDSAGDRVY